MSKEKKLTAEEKEAMRKERNKSLFSSILTTGITTASTFL